MGVDLLKHNQEAFQEISKMIESGTKKIAVPRATGSGKTYLIGALAEKYNSDKKLVLEPTRPLLSSIKEKFDEFGIENTDFMTYQKLIRMNDEDIAAMDYNVIFIDEAHHGTAPKWGQKIEHLMETHSDSIICGTSATTVRNDGVNVVESLFENNAIEEFPLSTAIARKVLPCPHYITAIYRLDDEFEKLKKRIEASTNTKEEKKEFYNKIKEMKFHFEKSYGVPLILNKYIKVRNGRYLVFCKNKKHLDAMRNVVIDWFHTAGIKDVHSYAVYSDYPDKEKDYNDFCEDNSDSLKLLFSIDMLNEGLHIKDISGVLMLRTTQSNLIYLQQLGRLVDAENIDKYLLVFDFVNNFSSVNDGIGLLKEIKEAIAKEKESNPDFDDSGFEDIDTYFVIDRVVEIQKMFREIEGRLEGSWDLYIKALKQYKEREGDCDVPAKHIEIVGEIKLALGNWCQTMRQAKEGKGRWKFTKEIEEQLNKEGFVWNVLEYRFEKNIKAISEFYKKYGKYPSNKSEDKLLKKLGCLINKEKMEMRCEDYPDWKMEIILKYLPEFSCETKWNKSFNEFVYYAKLYKNRFGHMQIKEKELIDSFGIGHRLRTIKDKYKDGQLSEENIKILEELGICLERKFQNDFNENMELAKHAINNGVVIRSSNEEKNLYNWIQNTVKKKYQNKCLSDKEIKIIETLVGMSLKDFYKGCMYIRYKTKFDLCIQAVNEGVILTESNRIYKGVNLVSWIKNHKKQFSDDEMEIIHQVMPPRPQNMPVRVIDVENHICKEYVSISEAGRALHNEFKVVASDNKGIKAIHNRLTGIIKSPVYKDRFRFEYADDKVS